MKTALIISLRRTVAGRVRQQSFKVSDLYSRAHRRLAFNYSAMAMPALRP